jgi:hypothetical protein
MGSGDQIPSAKVRLEGARRHVLVFLIAGISVWSLGALPSIIAELMGFELWLFGPSPGVAAILLVIAAGHTHRLSRMQEEHREGRCVLCRYELGGLETCPECGTPVDDPPAR